MHLQLLHRFMKHKGISQGTWQKLDKSQSQDIVSRTLTPFYPDNVLLQANTWGAKTAFMPSSGELWQITFPPDQGVPTDTPKAPQVLGVITM